MEVLCHAPTPLQMPIERLAQWQNILNTLEMLSYRNRVWIFGQFFWGDARARRNCRMIMELLRQ